MAVGMASTAIPDRYPTSAAAMVMDFIIDRGGGGGSGKILTLPALRALGVCGFCCAAPEIDTRVLFFILEQNSFVSLLV
jgi:hypothetical protein